MKVESREYKLLIGHEPFAEPDAAVQAVWDEIDKAAKTMPRIRAKGQLDEQETRTVFFLDTPHHTLRRHGLVLRQRSDDKTVEFTLKCRTDDRFVAAGTDVAAAGKLKGKTKLEEDIAPPFRCRFSHSTTIAMPGERKAKLRTLRDAAALYPLLKLLRLDGRTCSPKTALGIVNNIVVHEEVWKGGKIVFGSSDSKESDEKASVALILWSRGKSGQPAIAELSFRIEESEKRFSRSLAESARGMYDLLQRLDCSRPEGMTKTEYIYRDASRD